MDNKALELLNRLNYHITTVHLDMGGNNRYALSAKAHKVIDEIKLFLSPVDEQMIYTGPEEPAKKLIGAPLEADFFPGAEKADAVREEWPEKHIDTV